MVYFISAFGTLAVLMAAFWVIAFTLRDNMSAVVDALIGRHAAFATTPTPPAYKARILWRSDYRRNAQPLLRAAA